MKKILIISEGYFPKAGGLEKLVTELAESLRADRGYEVDVITSTRETICSQDVVNGINITYVPLYVGHGKEKLFRELLYAGKIIWNQLKQEYDFVVLQYLGYLAGLFTFVNRKKIPYSISIHGTDVIGGRRKSIIEKMLMKKAVTGAKSVISNSYYLGRQLEKTLGISITDKQTVIWNGIHLEKYDPDEAITTNNTIVSVGRFVYKKGFDVLVDAFSRMKKQCPDARLILVGDGTERAKCEQLAEKLGILDSIVFLGLVDNKMIPSVMKQGRFFVLPSRNEPFGIVVLEAMALGIPVIATDSGGVTEILDGGKFGCLIPTEDPDKMAECMIRFYEDDAQLEELREKGLDRVKQFSMERVVSQYDQIIKKYACSRH